MMKLKGKVALITGSNRGIGKGIAMDMAEQGADIVINYRGHADEAQQVVADIVAMGRQALAIQADCGSRESIYSMVDMAVAELGKVDICVCNAAISKRALFLELTASDFQDVINVSLLGVFNTAQACALDMVKRGEGGAILTISSSHAQIPFATAMAYGTCKAGINHMTHTMAEELLEHHIRANVIEPGWIDTPGERKFMDEAKIQEAARRLPWGRMGTVDEIAKAATFLCSDDASYITGATLRADGGFWLPSRDASSMSQ